ncbi:Ubiquinol oxidase subunit 1 [Budvicia aquatica]|uniref:Ubiquinol oxidase subunit 1 n=1 Tax=Budvicia aquatica TaxID=82979 RepID=A0A484ZCQ1_9GAMM|nr:Ubiquinol oxidase subunit 1 [Budvicia aquatica]
MLGKLTLEAIPYHEPIIMGAVGMIVIGGIAVLALLTYFGKWKWLWNEWLTSVDHKKNRCNVYSGCHRDVTARLC